MKNEINYRMFVGLNAFEQLTMMERIDCEFYLNDAWVGKDKGLIQN